MQTRADKIKDITQKLVKFTGLAMVVFLMIIYLKSMQDSYFIVMVIMSGLIGGLISLQQRLRSMDDEELDLLSSSNLALLLVPVKGGVFAVVLMLMFAGHIVQGELFPEYNAYFDINDSQSFKLWLQNGYPDCGTDAAKLLFWSFVAGFSERFVPEVRGLSLILARDRALYRKRKATQSQRGIYS